MKEKPPLRVPQQKVNRKIARLRKATLETRNRSIASKLLSKASSQLSGVVPTCLTLGPPAPPRRLARPEALPPPNEPPNSWGAED